MTRTTSRPLNGLSASGTGAKLIGGAIAVAILLLTAPAASAQVVQLPTFRSFGIGTTVLVPDGGTALIGGSRSGAIGSVSRGVPGLGRIPGAGRLFRNQATGGSFGVSTMTVTATIIDTEELDRMLLAEAAAERAERARRDRANGITVLDDDQQRRADFLNRHMGRNKAKR